MAMFECNADVVIRRPEGDGTYAETPSRALFIEKSSREARADDAPVLREESEFLFPPLSEVRPGDLVRYGERDYELASVRVCRDLDGKVVGRRCTVVH
ncbi:MAG: hypothetical protein J6Y54_01890 [Lentisphaeria bacterium]|jgi:hypothetical protein|nr:hypothetical protein [Lentisphaeria bacterium]